MLQLDTGIRLLVEDRGEPSPSTGIEVLFSSSQQMYWAHTVYKEVWVIIGEMQSLEVVCFLPLWSLYSAGPMWHLPKPRFTLVLEGPEISFPWTLPPLRHHRCSMPWKIHLFRSLFPRKCVTLVMSLPFCQLASAARQADPEAADRSIPPGQYF